MPRNHQLFLRASQGRSTAGAGTITVVAASSIALLLLVGGLAEHQHYLRDLILGTFLCLTPAAVLNRGHSRRR